MRIGCADPEKRNRTQSHHVSYDEPIRMRRPASIEQVRETRALTAKPFAVNLNLEFPQEERLDICLQEGVPVISLFWRDPSALVARAKAGGAVVLHTVGTAAEARHAVECGVDVVIAQGWEAGGHVRGMVGTMALVPAVVDAVGAVPAMAAGRLPMVVGSRQPWH
jgi:nitronate monooxygenase